MDIEKTITKTFLAEMIGVSAFTTLGIAASVGANNINLAIPLIGLLPIIVSPFLSFYQLKTKNFLRLSGITHLLHKRNFNQWFEKYLSDSESLTEKKYKTIFIALWLQNNKIKSSEMFDSYNSPLEKISEEIINNKESSYYIEDIYIKFFTTTKLATQYGLCDILKEDSIFPEKINIARKIAQEFSQYGLLGKNLSQLNQTAIFMGILQNYKLNQNDVSILEKTNEIYKKILPDSYEDHLHNRLVAFNDESYKYCIKIIDFNQEHLNLLESFFSQLKYISSDDRLSPVDYIKKLKIFNQITQKLESQNEALPLKKKNLTKL